MCDPEMFKERLVVVFTMLYLDLNSWLIRTKNPKTLAHEASLYGLCQLYSHHAFAYTMGSVWSMLELHGNYSVDKLKCHCDIHLVFLEGGILGQLHKKPTIPRLMGIPSKNTDLQVVVIDDTNNDNVQPGQTKCNVQDTVAPTLRNQGNDLDLDQTDASPTPQVHNEEKVNSVENDCNHEPHLQHDDHTYAELSDVPTEPYSCDSDSQDDVVTTGGKFIISRSDNVEISLEYQCNNTLPKVTKECTETATPINPVEKPSDYSSHGNSEEKHNVPDKTSETDLTKELPDDTNQNEVVLPDETLGEISVLPDKTDSVVKPDLPPLKADSLSSDAYPDTTPSAQALLEATDTNSEVISTESVVDTTSNLDNNQNMLDQTTSITNNENGTGELLGATKKPASPKHTLPDATAQDSLPFNKMLTQTCRSLQVT